MASANDISASTGAGNTAADHALQRRFKDLTQQHVGVIYGVARSYAWHSADREELEQEIVLQLWRAFPRYDAERAFSTWMYRIALNVAISYVRGHRQRERHFPAFTEAQPEAVDPSSVPGEQDERIDLLSRFIETVDPLNRALLLLYLEEHSAAEIGEILGITPSNVTTKLSRLKQRVRDYSAAIQGTRSTEEN